MSDTERDNNQTEEQYSETAETGEPTEGSEFEETPAEEAGEGEYAEGTAGMEEEAGEPEGAPQYDEMGAIPPAPEKTFMQKYFNWIAGGVIVVVLGIIVILVMGGGEEPQPTPTPITPTITEPAAPEAVPGLPLPQQPTAMPPESAPVTAPLPAEAPTQPAAPSLVIGGAPERPFLRGPSGTESIPTDATVAPSQPTTAAPAPQFEIPEFTTTAEPTAAVPEVVTTQPTPSVPGVEVPPTAVEAEQIQKLEAEVTELRQTVDRLTTELAASKQAEASATAETTAMTEKISELEKKLAEISKKAAAAAKAAKAPAKVSVLDKAPSAGTGEYRWAIISASPNQAWVSLPGTNVRRSIVTGDTLAGIGRVLSIEQENGRWVITGTEGKIQ